ncbi:MAG: TatD family hydrolase [Neptuniibacter sp.]
MQLIDTHCHLDFSVFDKDRSAVLIQAKSAGVTDYVVPGVTAEGWQQLLLLSENTEGMHPALGLHPCFMQQHSNEHIDQLAELLTTEKVCAVGEIGLDLFIVDADLEQQLSYLRPQLQLAKLHTLPVILHVRKAHDQMLKELRNINLESGGVVHAFSGSEQQATQYLKLGFKLGIGGTVTYERARKLHRIVRDNPLSSFVLETDSPDMPLAGYKGEKNVPGRVAEVAEAVADLKGVSIERVAEETTLSAQQLFKILDKKASLQ